MTLVDSRSLKAHGKVLQKQNSGSQPNVDTKSIEYQWKRGKYPGFVHFQIKITAQICKKLHIDEIRRLLFCGEKTKAKGGLNAAHQPRMKLSIKSRKMEGKKATFYVYFPDSNICCTCVVFSLLTHSDSIG